MIDGSGAEQRTYAAAIQPRFRSRLRPAAPLAVLVLSIVAAGCASSGVEKAVSSLPEPTNDQALSNERGSSSSRIPNGAAITDDTAAVSPQKLTMMLLEELNGVAGGFAVSYGSPSEIEALVTMVQRESGVPVTGELGRSDVALLRASRGQDLFSATILAARMRLANAGYQIDVLDAEFDDQLVLGLLRVSHDVGAPPDPTLSVANLTRVDEIAPAPSCPASDAGVAFRITGAQAIVDHVERLTLPPPIVLAAAITGDAVLDQRVVDRAIERGYEARSSAGDLTMVDGDVMLGPEAAVAWDAMRDAASLDGVGMFAASGHRSSEQQRLIFVNKLRSVAGTPLRSSTVTDEVIDGVLDSHAPPGFSKHQTGNAIDVAVPNVSLADFASTAAFAWLSDQDFANARRYGFVPSYPAGVEGLGPQPEPWEWLWVGVDVLFRCPPAT